MHIWERGMGAVIWVSDAGVDEYGFRGREGRRDEGGGTASCGIAVGPVTSIF